MDNAAKVRALGFSEQFIRCWDYYFQYCAAGFHTRTLGALPLLRPRSRSPPLPPPLTWA